MIRDYKYLIGLHHLHTENAFEVLESEMMAVRDLFVENYTYFPVNIKIIL